MSRIGQVGKGYSGHDYSILAGEWKRLAAERGWRETVLLEVNGVPVLAFENERAAEKQEGGNYVSVGVHGDECAPPWALLDWAESISEEADRQPLVIFPCLNPIGFLDNTRYDQNGVDLNRNFHNAEVPLIAAWQEFLAGRQFDSAINLHEDYDATGIYLYELARSESVGDALLAACEDIIPRESAEEVDGANFENGLMRRDVDEASLRKVVEEDLGGGWPEAIWLYLYHSRDAFTFETPSEIDLQKRVATQKRFLDEITRR